MSDLRTAAQQALEAWQGHQHGKCSLEKAVERFDALRAALAQQDEPVQEPYTGDVTRIMRDAGMTFHLGLPHKAVVEQMTRVVDLVYAEASIKAAQQFAAALAQQAEPAQEPAFHGFMSDDGTQVDVCFSPSAPRRDGTYATAYYTAPPQRRPLTEEEIDKIFKHLCNTVGASCKTMARAVERAHGIKE